MESVHEEWREVQGTGGVYQVSNLGRVRSLARKVIDSTGRRQSKPACDLKPSRHSAGYEVVSVFTNGQNKKRFVHDLVAAEFIGPRPFKHDVNHIDGVKTNNVASNLEYTTRTGNMRHAWDNKLIDNRGESNGMAKYTELQIRQCHAMVASGMTQNDAADRSGVSAGTANNVCRGKQWKHLNLTKAHQEQI